MDRPFPVAAIASCFALAGFAVAIFAGLGAERTTADVLGAALAALTTCYGVGYVAARAAEVGVREYVRSVVGGGSPVVGGATGAIGTDGTDVEIIGDIADQGAERARSV